jgi:hypothetical protein
MAQRADLQVSMAEEIVDIAVGMAVDDLGEHVGEVGVWVDAPRFAALDQRRPVFSAAVGTDEEGFFPIEDEGSDRALDRI